MTIPLAANLSRAAVASIHSVAERDFSESLGGGRAKPRGPPKMVEEDPFFDPRSADNGRPRTFVRLFQTVSEGDFPETQLPVYGVPGNLVSGIKDLSETQNAK